MKSFIEIFKPGTHTDKDGKSVTVTAADLKASAAAYNPDIHEAPIVVGHPKMDAPAYGWIKSLAFGENGKLVAEHHQVDVSFAEMVNEGKFKKVSASFFLPDSPGNPVPGVYYPKHIGFLGATPPAIKGLKTVQFAQDEEGVVEFADWDQMTIAGMFRRVREWFITKEGVEVADQVLPTYEIESLQINAVNDQRDNSVYFSEQISNQGEPMTPAEQERMRQLEADNSAQATQITTQATQIENLQTQVASFAKASKDALHVEHVSFAAGLVAAGRLLPAEQDAEVAMLDKLALEDSTVEFGEGDGKQTISSVAMYKAKLEKAPVVVSFGEHAGGEGVDTGTVSFSAPNSMSVSTEKLELHTKAVNYAKEHNVDYLTAVHKVS